MNSEKLLKHMAWANKEIFSSVAQLPSEALDAYATDPAWTAREIIRHICSSATWYGWRLLDKTQFTEEQTTAWQVELDATEIPPETSSDIALLIAKQEKADAILLEAAHSPEGTIERVVEGKTIIRARSTVISQSIYHATEHRAQLVSALQARGYKTINLDDFDLWAYCDKHGE